ncbi:MAG: sugar phosphate nucleotidyltransferase [Candidatus Hodarchaeota archaeon]
MDKGKNKEKEIKALITAGGKATRLRLITNAGNNHLIPIANKSMIYYAIEAYWVKVLK